LASGAERRRRKGGRAVVIVLVATAVLAIAFAAMALAGVFRGEDNSASPPLSNPVSAAGAEASSDVEIDGGATGQPADNAPGASGDTTQDAGSQPSAPADATSGGQTDAEPDDQADTAGAQSAPEGGDTAPPSDQGAGLKVDETASDYCSLIKRSEDVLTSIQVNPNDLQAMAAAMGSYLQAIRDARAVAPDSVHNELDVVIAYWEPLVAAANNPMSAQGGVGSQDMMDAYAEAMTSLYEKHATLCA
jgi:hypothetical protein